MTALPEPPLNPRDWLNVLLLMAAMGAGLWAVSVLAERAEERKERS